MNNYRVYKKGEYTFQDKIIAGKVYKQVLTDTNGNILSGNDHFIGKDEKRRNTEIIHIDMQYTCGNYALFYA